jgi:hypothetical protein
VDWFFGVAAGPNRSVQVGGHFTGTAQFGGGSLTTRGGYDVFVAQLQDNTPTAVRAAGFGQGATLFPNPLARGTSAVSLRLPPHAAGAGALDLLDATGRVLQHLALAGGDGNERDVVLLDTRGLAAGTYWVKYATANASFARPLVIQQ